MAATCEYEDWRDDPTYNDEPLADGDLFAGSPGRTYVRPADVRFVPPGRPEKPHAERTDKRRRAPIEWS